MDHHGESEVISPKEGEVNNGWQKSIVCPSSIQQMFTEGLLCAKHNSGCMGFNTKQRVKDSCPLKFIF